MEISFNCWTFVGLVFFLSSLIAAERPTGRADCNPTGNTRLDAMLVCGEYGQRLFCLVGIYFIRVRLLFYRDRLGRDSSLHCPFESSRVSHGNSRPISDKSHRKLKPLADRSITFSCAQSTPFSFFSRPLNRRVCTIFLLDKGLLFSRDTRKKLLSPDRI